MAVDCLLKVLDPQRPDLLDLKDVKVGWWGAVMWAGVGWRLGLVAGVCVLHAYLRFVQMCTSEASRLRGLMGGLLHMRTIHATLVPVVNLSCVP